MNDIKKKNIKKVILGSFLGILIGGLLGTTYAMFTYNATSMNGKLVVGDIYMKYKDNNELSLSNVMPSSTYSENGYFEFEVSGKNTTTDKDIIYDIVINHGVDNPNSRTTRIRDKFLKFRLVEVTEENNVKTEVTPDLIEGKSFSKINNTRIYVRAIPKNTTSEIKHIYRLYMWIDNSVVIGNTNQDYTLEEWKNVYASISVTVNGDFQKKELTPSLCFKTINNGDNTLSITGYETDKYNFNSNITNEGVQACINYITNKWGAEEDNDFLWDGETYDKYCRGTGTLEKSTFQDAIDHDIFDQTDLDYFEEQNIITFHNSPEECHVTDIVIPSSIDNKSVTKISEKAFFNNQLTSVEIPNSVTTIEDYAFWSNSLIYVTIPNSVTTIGSGAFWGNQLTSVTIPNSVTTISDSAFIYNQLTSVTIPNSVTTIGDGAFQRNKLTSVNIPNSVTTIDSGAFWGNQLTSVTIPNSVTTIGDSAFIYNQLTSIEIPNSVTTIGGSAFANNQLTSIEIPNSVTTIGGSAFSDNQLTSVTIPNNVTTIGLFAFSRNNLTDVHIGNGLNISSIYTLHDIITKGRITTGYGGITHYDNPNLSSIYIDKSCNELDNSYCDGSNCYSGVTIYGSNNEVCYVF